MVLYILIFIITFLFVLLYRSKQKYIKRCLQSFNGPPPKFLVGEFKDNSVENLKVLKNLQDKYGPICKLFIGPRAYLMVSDPELVEMLLTSQKHLKKSADYQLLQPWLMNGCFCQKGHDTTASAISFTLYDIAHNPHVQDKIIEELFSDNSGRQPTLQDFNNMKYLELVIKEAMRRYPPVLYFSRELVEDLEYKGILIPEGVTITVFTYHMHQRPELFPNPEEFNPDRFLYDGHEQKNHFAYIPFSAGPRNCIGQKFAMFELKAVLSKILRNFKVLAADSKYNVVLSGEIILKTANGVSIRLERRHF